MIAVPHWPKTFGKKLQIDLKIDRMLEILERLGNPHLKIPPVIHVAGTNGKGSTVSYMTSILRQAGYKVHNFTSPHLIEFNERIVLDGTQISDAHTNQVIERVRIAAESKPIQSDGNVGLTLFEATTAAAFLAFSEVPADFLVLEVGMGGRLDATNVVKNTIISIITPVDIDHAEFLGETITEIAHEKAGIMRCGIPCVIGKQTTEGMRVLEFHASSLQSPVFRYDKDYGSEQIDNGNFDYFHINHENNEKFNRQTYPNPSLIGPHQIENVSMSIAAIELLVKYGYCQVYYEDICHAITHTYWPARFEPITSGKIVKMVPKDWEIYLDGAHNPHGATALSRWALTRTDKPIYFIFGTTRGKDIVGYLEVIKPVAKFVCGICVNHETNAQRGTEISDAAEKLNIPTKPFDFLPNAIKYIVEIGKSPAIIIICGSLYLAADVMKINKNLIFADEE